MASRFRSAITSKNAITSPPFDRRLSHSLSLGAIIAYTVNTCNIKSSAAYDAAFVIRLCVMR